MHLLYWRLPIPLHFSYCPTDLAFVSTVSTTILTIFMEYWRAANNVQIHRVWLTDLHFIGGLHNAVSGFGLLEPASTSSFGGLIPPTSGLSQ